MKHLLTAVLLFLATAGHAQIEETKLINQSLTQIVNIKGAVDDRGYNNNGEFYIAYYHKNVDHGTVFYFDGGFCDEIFVVAERQYEYKVRNFLNKNYYRVGNEKWLDLTEDVELRLLNIKGTVTVKITD